jgi:hypothetical protein
MWEQPAPSMKSYLNLPLGLVNAHVQPGLQMRIGLPQNCGGLLKYAAEKEYPAMLSAAAFWKRKQRRFHMPETSPLEEMDWALDSAGFTAMLQAKKKGYQPGLAHLFDWALETYVAFATTSGAAWWSAIDYCCESAISDTQDEIDYRIDMTCTTLHHILERLWGWANKLADEQGYTPTMIANTIRPPVPVLQGRRKEDYLRCAEQTFAIWDRFTPWLAQPALVGIGSMCTRDVDDPKEGLRAVLQGLEGCLPQGAKAHIFGVKGTFLTEVQRDFPWIASVDSMAWDSGARWAAHKRGESNTNAHRIEHMTQWAENAFEQVSGRASSNACQIRQLELPLAA